MEARIGIKKQAAVMLAAAGIILTASSGVALAQTFDGTDKEDHLIGTPQRDIMSGLDGRDVIEGLGGYDSINGGKSKDDLYGGPGKDRVVGGPGNDRIIAGKGDDRVRAFDGDRDSITCGDGADSVFADQLDFIKDGKACENITVKQSEVDAPAAA